MSWYGPETLSDAELLTLLLDPNDAGETTMTRARSLLEQVGGLSRLRHLRPHSVTGQSDMDSGEAQRVLAGIELGMRVQRDVLIPPSTQPLSFELVVDWARPRMAGLDHEEVWVLCVNSHSSLQSAWQVGRGGMHGCGLLARDLLLPVVRDGASGFILIHNHPSGDPTPSQEDIDLTRGLQLAGTSLCIPLLDHVIVARGGASSFFELGYLDV